MKWLLLFQALGMESNQFQKFLGDELKRRSAAAGVYVPVKDIHNTTDKLGRIQRLQPLISLGTLRFSKRHITLLEQLRQFPVGAHDDVPDAPETAVSAAGTPCCEATFQRASRACPPALHCPVGARSCRIVLTTVASSPSIQGRGNHETVPLLRPFDTPACT